MDKLIEDRARKAWFECPNVGETTKVDFAVYFAKKELEDLKKQLRQETRKPSYFAKIVQELVDDQGRIHRAKFVKFDWVMKTISGREG